MRELEFRWTRATVLMTVIAIVMALTSLVLEWYSCTVAINGDVHEYDFYLRTAEGPHGIYLYVSTGFDHVQNTIGWCAVLILLWALVSIVYLAIVLGGDSGFLVGWLLIALAVLPLAVYVLFIQSSAEADFHGTAVSELSPGPFLASLGVLFQAASVISRNIQVLRPGLSAGGTEKVKEQLEMGDLPER